MTDDNKGSLSDKQVEEIKSTINAKHSLLGIAILLLIQSCCITDHVDRSIQEIKTICTEQKK